MLALGQWGVNVSVEQGIGFAKVDYQDLNAKQREVYNFHFIAARLAQYGYASYPIRDDWNGGDMFSRHMLSGQALTVQIKSRATFDKKYLGKDLHIGFPLGEAVFVYPHDQVLSSYMAGRTARGLPLDDNQAWSRDGLVHWVNPTKEIMGLLKPYELAP